MSKNIPMTIVTVVFDTEKLETQSKYQTIKG